MKALLVVTFVMFLILTARLAGQTICFDQTDIAPGTTSQVYETTTYQRPNVLQAALPPDANLAKADQEMRTETWLHVGDAGLDELQVSWTKYDHEYSFFVPESDRELALVDTCYHVWFPKDFVRNVSRYI